MLVVKLVLKHLCSQYFMSKDVSEMDQACKWRDYSVGSTLISPVHQNRPPDQSGCHGSQGESSLNL